jgi:FHA domain
MPQIIISLDGVTIRQVYLQNESTSVGRKPHHHVVLADQTVSGDHCTFEQSGLTDVFVVDVGSTNGTYINGKMVRRHLLQDGDVMAIGRYRVKYLSANELTDEAQTAAMPLESFSQSSFTQSGFDPSQSAALGTPLQASLRVLSGTSTGLVMPVVKAVSTYGRPGVTMVAIAHRRHGYYVSCMEASDVPTLNGIPISNDPVLLQDRDVLELAGTAMEFCLR